MRLLCVTPNAALDRTLVVPGFHAGGVWRARSVVAAGGGKGVNVARAARRLGHGAICAGLLAGPTGRLVAALTAAEGLEADWTWIEGETRTCIIVVDPEAGPAGKPQGSDPTVINEPGPRITPADWQALAAAVLRQAALAEAVCISGSLPPGSPAGGFAALIRDLGTAGRPVWVDTSGAALAETPAARPAGLKVNAAEAGTLLGRAIDGIAAALDAAAALRSRGAAQVGITLGRDGAILVGPGGAWHARPPAVMAISPVGSGDAFLAGLVGGLASGLAPDESLRRAAAAGAANALHGGGGRFEPAAFERILAETTVAPCVISV